MVDRFRKQQVTLSSPYNGGFAITPNNSILEIIPRALWIGQAGNLTVELTNYDSANGEITLAGIAAGTLLRIRPQKVLSSTTANSIIGLY